MRRMPQSLWIATLSIALPAPAFGNPTLERVNGDEARLTWTAQPIDIRLSDDPIYDEKDPVAQVRDRGPTGATITYPAHRRSYVLLRTSEGGEYQVVAERSLPLEKGSNFRDLGGYLGADGKRVAWGRIYRSGALPMLSENDYSYLGELEINAIVDLRSIDERQVAPDLLDDRNGALYVSNDYPIAPLIEAARRKGDGALYAGTEKRLTPQLRSMFNLLLRDEGAVMFHCSAGQDRTGIAAALILSALGVDRNTIFRDYHLSTALRRPQYEMPEIDPSEFPDNIIVQIYAQQRAEHGELKAEPLYTKDGQSHIVMFFDYLDQTYGGAEAYLASELDIGPDEIERLRDLYLD